MWCGVVWCGAIGGVVCGLWCGMMWSYWAWCGGVGWYGVVWGREAWCGVVFGVDSCGVVSCCVCHGMI